MKQKWKYGYHGNKTAYVRLCKLQEYFLIMCIDNAGPSKSVITVSPCVLLGMAPYSFNSVKFTMIFGDEHMCFCTCTLRLQLRHAFQCMQVSNDCAWAYVSDIIIFFNGTAKTLAI